VLAHALASVRPSVLLLMGRAAAQAVLGRTEPLGQLRGQAHTVAGLPAVITYDAPYLLRAPQAKPAAWSDLCLARVLARSTPARP
jgi:DNA polymerase